MVDSAIALAGSSVDPALVSLAGTGYTEKNITISQFALRTSRIRYLIPTNDDGVTESDSQKNHKQAAT